MLDGTKDLSTVTVKDIGEGIQNVNINLENILYTLIWLSTLGESYFKGNFADRGRFESLVLPDYMGFLNLILNKLGELGLTLNADRLLENKNRVILYLKQNKWTSAEMTSHVWFTDKYNDYCYGK